MNSIEIKHDTQKYVLCFQQPTWASCADSLGVCVPFSVFEGKR